MLHFEQRSALKCCISQKERCQFSTDVKWHCFIGPNRSSAILQLLLTPALPESTFPPHTQPQFMTLQSRDNPKNGGSTLASLVPLSCAKKKVFQAILFPHTLTAWDNMLQTWYLVVSALSHKDQQQTGSYRACWLKT